MKRFTFLAALGLLGLMASCSQKVCPAYSQADGGQPNSLAKAAPALARL